MACYAGSARFAIDAFFVAGQAFAATVNATSGQVFLSQGEGYRKVVGSTQAGPGARVVVNPGGSGQIVYPDGCVIEVAPGVVAVVAKHSPCGGGGGTAKSTGGGGSGSGSAGGDTGLFAVGAAVVGAGVGAAALMGKDKSASP
jgi:hypothetical protein